MQKGEGSRRLGNQSHAKEAGNWAGVGPGRSVWRPRFSARLINPNELVNYVDFGQMTVNLGHHLENIIDKP
jgi:hypothetical protein